jgi:hypothetical protein
MTAPLRRRRGRRTAVLLAVLAVAALVGTPAASAQAPVDEGVSVQTDAATVLSPLSVRTLAQPVPVVGADGRRHLAYELVLANAGSDPVTIDTVTVRSGGRVLDTLQGDGLSSMVRVNGEGPGTTLPPGGSGYLWLDVTLPLRATVPSRLLHQLSFTVGGPSGPAPPRSVSFTGVPVTVSRAVPVVVAPPLRGSDWIVGNGCCAPPNAHRGAILPINGTLHVSERFAIDFVQLGANGATAQSDPAMNTGFGYFGTDILSVAPGTVVNTQNGLPEQVPGALPADATLQTAGGNFVVVDIGHGRYAFYAHMQPGSLRVKVGDRVRTGTVIGRLGNTGNTDQPHLHFHVMDGPSPLLSNGLPFTFTRFAGRGVVTDESLLSGTTPVPIDPTAMSGPHRRELPLNLQVIDFPG